jgi:hypothetical protein
MAATTAPTKTEIEKTPMTGTRFIIWNPRLDPTVYAAPQRSTAVRFFTMSWMDSIAFALTPVAPGGGITPTFKSLMLFPGLNEISCEEWAAAVKAGQAFGGDRQQVRPSHSPEERLTLSSQHGLDPLQEQIEAGSIVVPELVTDSPLGTIGDYSSKSIVKILDTVTDVQTLQSWMTGIAQGAIVCQDKSKTEKAIKARIDTLNGVR